MADINFGILQQAPNPGITTQTISAAPAQPDGLLQVGMQLASQALGPGGLLTQIFGKSNSPQALQATNTAQAAQLQRVPSQTPGGMLQGVTSQSPQIQQIPSQIQGAKQQIQAPASIQQLQELAARQFPDNPVLQRIAVAQATQESNLLGQPSGLARNANNYFGMKGHGTAGSVNMNTNEFEGGRNVRQQAGFAAYNSPAESIQAYADLINHPRYAGVRNATSVAEAAQALHDAGYATDPNYARHLVAIDARLRGL